MIETQHHGNIFCAEMQPHHESTILSCAADGALCMTDLNTPNHTSKTLMTTSALMHMFIYDITQPDIVYTAEECGNISRIDLRIPTTGSGSSGIETIYKDKRGQKVYPIKALAQNEYLGEYYILVGGAGFNIHMYDIRLLSLSHTNSSNSNIYTKPSDHAVKLFSPYGRSSYLNGHCWFNSGSSIYGDGVANYTGDISVSGLQISRDGRTILASYQGDQIYTYDIHDNIKQQYTTNTKNSIGKSYTSSSNNNKSIGVKGVYGGHFNYQTFLKTVSFFGPK